MSRSAFLNGKADEIFAIGCFHFVQKKWQENDAPGEDYALGISNSLEKIDNVSNVSVSEISGFSDIGFHPKYEDDDEESYLNIPFIPCPSSGLVTFDVFIPKRVQEEVYPYGYGALHCEKFKVLVDFGGDFPIALIKPGEVISGDLSEGFSNFVPVIRNYLASRWPKDASVKFACLGPSPFHAEFYFQISEKEDLKIEKRRGYDSILYQGPNLTGFYRQIRAVLPNFYLQIYTRNRLMEIEYSVSYGIRSVIDRLTERNLFVKIKNYFLLSNKKDIADIYSLRFEAADIRRIVTERIEYNKRGDDSFTDSALWDYVAEKSSETQEESGQDLNQLLRLAEIFEMGGATNSSTVFAAISSAILTALAAILIAVMTDDRSTSAPSVAQAQNSARGMASAPAHIER